ncbi:MAG TPA: NAD-dependent epimerase/dehydratase family protein [Rhodothermales bacterium]|nr:NAD-dependent epimerase/dehydratase family protein [Rhodothermales bacterium]
MRILVTGATGFLGGHAARLLLKRGHDVVGTGRDAAAGAALERDGIPFVQGALADTEALARATEGCEAVVHSAALSSPWGRAIDFHRANVEGTRYVLAAARAAGARRFVHVSTPSIYFTGKDRLDIPEDTPLPAHYPSHYPTTKREAEGVVRTEAGPLEAVLLRPRALFGPGDGTILPRLLAAHRTGRLRIVGDGQNVVDLTYIDNAALACALAVEAPAADVNGHAFNVTNGEPVRLWDFVSRVLTALGMEPPTKHVPYRVAYAAAAALEAVARLRPGRPAPTLTRYSVALLALSQTLDLTAARERLGYTPAVSLDDGLERTVAALRAMSDE